MHHRVVEHPIVPLRPDTPAGQNHERIKVFPLLLGDSLVAMMPPVRQRQVRYWNKVMKDHWVQQPKPYLTRVNATNQEVNDSLSALCTKGTCIAVPEIVTPKTVGCPAALQRHKPHKKLTLRWCVGFAQLSSSWDVTLPNEERFID
jgi:hypothetical protein